jgi:homoserine dehydrogenase
MGLNTNSRKSPQTQALPLNNMKPIRVGFLGLGTVGQGVWEQLLAKSVLWEEKLGCSITPVLAAVRNPSKPRDIHATPDQITGDSDAVVTHPDVDLVIELIGGTEEAKRLTLLAFANGKSVISANKALICEHGKELLEAARDAGVHYLYEASVAGGIPIVKVLQESLTGNRIACIQGILNGTSNYILTRMEREELAYTVALSEAKSLGYVEEDEALDLDGFDAAHKLLILTYLCFNQWFPIADITIEGIRPVSLIDIRAAAHLKCKVKLIATLREYPEAGEIACSVRPCLVPLTNNLSSVDDAYNGLRIQGDIVGTTFLIGRGAGRYPTTSSILSDVVDYCRSNRTNRSTSDSNHYRLATADRIIQCYYLRFEVDDVKGVLSEITLVLSQHDISISTIEQVLNPAQHSASIMLTTHQCSDASILEVRRILSNRSFLLSAMVVFPILDS